MLYKFNADMELENGGLEVDELKSKTQRELKSLTKDSFKGIISSQLWFNVQDEFNIENFIYSINMLKDRDIDNIRNIIIKAIADTNKWAKRSRNKSISYVMSKNTKVDQRCIDKYIPTKYRIRVSAFEFNMLFEVYLDNDNFIKEVVIRSKNY